MKENVEKLENLLEVKYEDWNLQTLMTIIEKEELRVILTPETATFLVENRTNDALYDVMLPIKYGFYIRKMKGAIEAGLTDLNEKKIDESAFKEILIKLLSGSFIDKMGAYLAFLTMFPAEPIDEADLKATMNGILDLIETIDLASGLEVSLEFLDLVFPVRELYFKVKQIDLVEDKTRLEKILTAIDEKISLFAEREEDAEEAIETDAPEDNTTKE